MNADALLRWEQERAAAQKLFGASTAKGTALAQQYSAQRSAPGTHVFDDEGGDHIEVIDAGPRGAKKALSPEEREHIKVRYFTCIGRDDDIAHLTDQQRLDGHAGGNRKGVEFGGGAAARGVVESWAVAWIRVKQWSGRVYANHEEIFVLSRSARHNPSATYIIIIQLCCEIAEI